MRDALEHKLETVLVDVNLLRADHKKVTVKVMNCSLQIYNQWWELTMTAS